MIELSTLLSELEVHFLRPQNSERWSMYRLIIPVIDIALGGADLWPYFEWTQISRHKTTQSVDIALLSGARPTVLIEAKRYDRKIDAEMIQKYMEPGLRGIVTNGWSWILCDDQETLTISIWNPNASALLADNLMTIVDFIRGDDLPRIKTPDDLVLAAPARPRLLAKKVRATRKQNPMTRAYYADEITKYVASLNNCTPNDRAFISAFTAERLGFPESLIVEMRASRMSVFYEGGKSRPRLMRIEFGKQAPSVIVQTEIVQQHPSLDEVCASRRHDKHAGMREFRLSSEDQAEQLGLQLADIMAAAPQSV